MRLQGARALPRGSRGARSPNRRRPQTAKLPPKGAPHRVNWIIVRWTIIQEGHALQERAAPSPSPVSKPLQGRKPLNEQSKSPKAPTFRLPLIIHHFNQDCNTYPQTFIILPQSQKIKTAKSVEYVEYRQEYLRA